MRGVGQQRNGMVFWLTVACYACLVNSAFAQSSYEPRTAQNLKEIIPQIRTLVVLPPKVDLFELSAGGMREPMEDWSAQAKLNMTAAVLNYLNTKDGITVRMLEAEHLPKDVATNLNETWALYDTVESSIILHTYSQVGSVASNIFQDKISNFDYSLGSETSGLAEQTDALLIVRGLEQRSTVGRKAVQAGVALLGLVAGRVVVPPGSRGVVSAALVDAHTGSILWYKRSGSASGMNESDGSKTTVLQLMSDFPIR
jgi:hypothetical protein